MATILVTVLQMHLIIILLMEVHKLSLLGVFFFEKSKEILLSVTPTTLYSIHTKTTKKVIIGMPKKLNSRVPNYINRINYKALLIF